MNCAMLRQSAAFLAWLLSISAIVNAQGFIWDKGHTCKIYTTANTDTRSFTYDGDCKNNFVNGKATVTIYDNGRQIAVITGNFTSGILSGECSMQFSDGASFKGRCENGVKKYGIYNYANGARYEGEFDINGRSGKGTQYLSPGSEYYKYVGDFKNDDFEGYGTGYFSDGSVAIKGQFAKGLPNGKIEHTFKNGARYIGTELNGSFSGEGTIYFREGSKYQGIFDHDISTRGTLTYNDGTVKKATYPKACDKIEESCIKLDEEPVRGSTISDGSEYDEPDWKSLVAEYRKNHRIQMGSMFFQNNLKGLTGVALYHSDNPGDKFAFTAFSEGESGTIQYNNKDLTLGNDWYIMVYNEFKGVTDKYFIGDVAKGGISGYSVSANDVKFTPQYFRIPGNSFTSSASAAEYLDASYFATSKTKKGNNLVDPIVLDFTDIEYLYFNHLKGTISEQDIINRNEHAANAVEADEMKDAEEYGMPWRSITGFSLEQRGSDYYITIYGIIEDEDKNKKGDHISLYVPAAKRDKIRNALAYLQNSPCTAASEISRIDGIFDKKAADKKVADKKAAEQKHKDYLRTKFSSLNDAKNYLENNLAHATTGNYYVELNYSLSGINFRYKTTNSAGAKVIADITVRWNEISTPELQEHTVDYQGKYYELRIFTNNDKAIAPGNSTMVFLALADVSSTKNDKIAEALEYMRVFAD